MIKRQRLLRNSLVESNGLPGGAPIRQHFVAQFCELDMTHTFPESNCRGQRGQRRLSFGGSVGNVVLERSLRGAGRLGLETFSVAVSALSFSVQKIECVEVQFGPFPKEEPKLNRRTFRGEGRGWW